jgi:hypothetical protein
MRVSEKRVQKERCVSEREKREQEAGEDWIMSSSFMTCIRLRL